MPARDQQSIQNVYWGPIKRVLNGFAYQFSVCSLPVGR